MNHRLLSPIALVFAAPFVVSAEEPFALGGTQWAQLSVHERIVIRIPRVRPQDAERRPFRDLPPPIVWSEKKAPKCVATARLAGAAITGGGDVDLMLADGRRLRAKLNEDCPTLSFYSGFYLKPNSDGMICARRDALRTRSGARCEISRFRTLVARR